MENDTTVEPQEPFVKETAKVAVKSAAVAVGACLGIFLVGLLTNRNPADTVVPVETTTKS